MPIKTEVAFDMENIDVIKALLMIQTAVNIFLLVK